MQQLKELLLRNQSGTGANLLNEYIQQNINNVAFYKELLDIFVEDTDRVGTSAGLVLKNHIYHINDPAFIEYITNALLSVPRNDRFRVGIIGTILGKLHLHFPSIPVAQHILELFANDPSASMFNIVDKMCQEKELELQPIHFSIILAYLTTQECSRFAFDIISTCINSYQIDQFIPELINQLCSSPNMYRQQSLQLLTKIAEYKSQLLIQSNFEDTLKYVFNHFDLDGAEFILAFVENNNFRDALNTWLPTLVPLLLLGMQYTSEEVQSTLEDDEIAPRHHLAQVHNQQVDDDDEDDIDFYGDWNFRKCCASTLDALSDCFKGQLLPIILPLLKDSFSNSDWLVREAGILALGAIADGCDLELNVFLDELIPFLLNCCSDPHPLVISISVWALSRFSLFICQSSHFEPALSALLQGLQNNNSKVQECSCAALTVFSDYAHDLSNYKVPIMNAIVPCLGVYSKKNLIMLMDALGQIAYIFNDQLRDPVIMNAIIPPLLQYWDNIKISDVIFPTLLDCLQHLFVAFGPLVMPFAQNILLKICTSCIAILDNLLLVGIDSDYDASHVQSNLDLASGLLNGLASESSVFYMFRVELNAIFHKCLEHDDLDIHQSIYGLLGEICRFQFQVIKEHHSYYYAKAVHQLGVLGDMKTTSNSVWFIGEYTIQVNGQLEHLDVVTSKLHMLLIKEGEPSANLVENVAVTIARIAVYNPVAVINALNGQFGRFVEMLNVLHDPNEKMSAYSGLYAMITVQSNIIMGNLRMILLTIANNKTNEVGLYELMKKVISINVDHIVVKAVPKL
eukprot:NODE_125_length_18781_cov_0.243015.p1 type:complete len:798 gc:universal NODE_125_length_18781_cov_0.243015:3739-6132(+)